MPCSQVIAVDSDSILYVNGLEHVRTAWLYRNPESGKLRVRMEVGFRIHPPDWSVG